LARQPIPTEPVMKAPQARPALVPRDGQALSRARSRRAADRGNAAEARGAPASGKTLAAASRPTLDEATSRTLLGRATCSKASTCSPSSSTTPMASRST
jgi:hypothetical protein